MIVSHQWILILTNFTAMETIDTYFKTDNEHWNETGFNVYNKAIESGLFSDTETPVKLFDKAVNYIYENRETPVMAVTETIKELEPLEAPQQLFILKQIARYFKYTEFDGAELTDVQTLIESHIKAMRPKQPKASNLRETLKGIVMAELETLPETIKELEPDKRLNIVCKLMPYVMPRVESVHFEKGEPGGLNW